jgi:transposase InsO family protein
MAIRSRHHKAWSCSPTSAGASCTSPSRPIRPPPGRRSNSAKRSRGTTLRYLIRDRDLAFAAIGATAEAMAITEVLTAPRSPWQNAYIERFIGSVRRECLDHLIVFNTGGLLRILKRYVEYYEGSRTHLALNKDAPVSRDVSPPTDGRIIATPQVGGFIIATNGRRGPFRLHPNPFTPTGPRWDFQ